MRFKKVMIGLLLFNILLVLITDIFLVLAFSDIWLVRNSQSENIRTYDVEFTALKQEDVSVPVPENDNKANKIEISSEDRELLAKLLYLEGRGESVECQKAIISVVVNRLNSGYWGKTYREVIYSKNQFSPAKYISKTEATKTQYEVVDDIIKNGTTLPCYVLYFRAGHFFDWCKSYVQIDNTYFSYTQKDYNNLGGK